MQIVGNFYKCRCSRFWLTKQIKWAAEQIRDKQKETACLGNFFKSFCLEERRGHRFMLTKSQQSASQDCPLHLIECRWLLSLSTGFAFSSTFSMSPSSWCPFTELLFLLCFCPVVQLLSSWLVLSGLNWSWVCCLFL